MNLYKSLILSSIFLLIGCSSSYQIVDQSGEKFTLKKASTGDQSPLILLHGESTQKIPLENIVVIQIDPRVSTYSQNKLFYQVEISLISGVTIKPISTKQDTSKSFICVDQKIIGENEAGKFQISFKDIKVLRQVDIQ